MSEGEQAAMRRQPQQARSQQRVAQILGAAEALFAESGYAATTTNQIAARAEVPIGSLYQFFPHKEAILHALTARYRTAAAALLDGALTPAARTLPLEALLTRLLGAMIELGMSQMAFTRLVLLAGGQPELGTIAATLQADVAARVDDLLAERAPTLPPARRALTARVATTAVFALLALLVAEKQQGEAHSKALLAEMERMLGAYLVATVRAELGE